MTTEPTPILAAPISQQERIIFWKIFSELPSRWSGHGEV